VLAVYITANISGGHVNPAVTLAKVNLGSNADWTYLYRQRFGIHHLPDFWRLLRHFDDCKFAPENTCNLTITVPFADHAPTC